MFLELVKDFVVVNPGILGALPSALSSDSRRLPKVKTRGPGERASKRLYVPLPTWLLWKDAGLVGGPLWPIPLYLRSAIRKDLTGIVEMKVALHLVVVENERVKHD